MPDAAQIDLKSATEIARIISVQRAPNGIHYGSYGDTQLSDAELEQLVQAIPLAIAAALHRRVFYFVPLAMAEPTQAESSGSAPSSPDAILIASNFTSELGDNAICHRNATIAGVECVFLSTRLMQDRFALAFELYINAGHHFVETVGVPQTFMDLLWSQAEAGVRGETSQDAWECRARALGPAGMEPASDLWSAPRNRSRRKRPQPIDTPRAAAIPKNAVDEKARMEFFDVAFADAIAIYLLSLTVDFDYVELRERDYPLLAAPALAERLRQIAQLFPPNVGQEFSMRSRRRDG